jgi:hypothetical protein
MIQPRNSRFQYFFDIYYHKVVSQLTRQQVDIGLFPFLRSYEGEINREDFERPIIMMVCHESHHPTLFLASSDICV